ncbi:glycosyltransferase family 1 protein [Thelephora terrestris]|uniref:UDP-N-acetylglucosamine transferase subunit ALG14 n=1 Tax=Thelephora terrestris TaxID=56493 RepID=A0A9P6HS88_9AGAM|nr:glycosyltransferase family 1 protein [Thelephora terrestris]
MSLLSTITTLIVAFSTVCVLRILFIFKRGHCRSKRAASDTCGLAVFLGSGGHTTEALALVSALDFSRYNPRTYIISDGDNLSAQKAHELEERKSERNRESNYTIIYVPRARRVHQPLWTTPPTVLASLVTCVKHAIHAALQPEPVWDILILNGPGTCFSICTAVYLNRFLGLASPRILYIESFARVRSLSLSGRLLRPFVDRFIVQWPEVLQEGGRSQYFGCLV